MDKSKAMRLLSVSMRFVKLLNGSGSAPSRFTPETRSFSKPARVHNAELDLSAELKLVKKELARVTLTEESNILKKATVYFA